MRQKVIDNKVLINTINDTHADIKLKFENVCEADVLIQRDLEFIKSMIKTNDEKLSKLAIPEGKINDELVNLKKESSVTWADIIGKEVKKNVEVLNEEVRGVHKALNDVCEAKDRENNLMIFNLQECDINKNKLKIF